ncbi:hypothetical protein BTVI_105368 [Pitangus sulphuratus]|nr:hypothetical protein BTVI_105368 [Pitangus sulphuratus]
MNLDFLLHFSNFSTLGHALTESDSKPCGSPLFKEKAEEGTLPQCPGITIMDYDLYLINMLAMKQSSLFWGRLSSLKIIFLSTVLRTPVCSREIAVVCTDSAGPELQTLGQMLVLADVSDMEQKLLECKSLSMNCKLKT